MPDKDPVHGSDDERGGRAPAGGTRFGSSALGIFLGLLMIGTLAWILWPQGAAQRQAGRRNGDAPTPVVAAAVERRDMPVRLGALGTVTPLATVTVKTQINGRITAIGFTEGQAVKKGDFLAEIDPRPYQIALEQAHGQLLHDQALLNNALVDLERYRKLAAQDSIAKQQLDTQEYLVRQYQGTVATDQAQVDNARLNLDYCHIVAPISGRVGLRQVDEGNYVQASDANGIVVITQLKPISVIFTLPEDNLPTVMARLRAGASLPVAAYDRSGTTVLASGMLATVDNQIDTATGTVKLRAQFDNADDALFPNQFVNVTLLTDTLREALVVPGAAIQRGAPGTFVYVVGPGDTVAIQPVKLGPTDGEKIAVLSGLAAGQRVVIDGADRLRAGIKVALPRLPASTGPLQGGARAGLPGDGGGRAPQSEK